jgi:hypothetical protein
MHGMVSTLVMCVMTMLVLVAQCSANDASQGVIVPLAERGNSDTTHSSNIGVRNESSMQSSRRRSTGSRHWLSRHLHHSHRSEVLEVRESTPAVEEVAKRGHHNTHNGRATYVSRQ